jgi:hypothetical protein
MSGRSMSGRSMSDSSLSETSAAETLVEDFETFFIELPADVRNDLWFMMVILSDENFVFHDGTDIYERSAQGLFQAKTRIGRLGNLIQAASIFDVYFAMDAGERFGANGKAKPSRGGHTALYRYANQAGAIAAAKERWHKLRTTKFTPTAIAAALIPPGLPRKRAPRASASATQSDLEKLSA